MRPRWFKVKILFSLNTSRRTSWKKHSILEKGSNCDFRPMFFEHNFDVWPQFRCLTKMLIFDQNFDFWPKFWFLTKVSIFDQNFDFWPKFRFLIKILIFDHNFDFWPQFRFLTKISTNFEFPENRFQPCSLDHSQLVPKFLETNLPVLFQVQPPNWTTIDCRIKPMFVYYLLLLRRIESPWNSRQYHNTESRLKTSFEKVIIVLLNGQPIRQLFAGTAFLTLWWCQRH